MKGNLHRVHDKTVQCALVYCVLCLTKLCSLLGYTIECAWVSCVVSLGILCACLKLCSVLGDTVYCA